MNERAVLSNISKTVFTRQDLLDAASIEMPEFKETDIRNLLEKLIANGDVTRIARNRYICGSEYNSVVDYSSHYSREANQLIKDVKEHFPYIGFQVWELSWFNEFLVHLVSRNMIFVDVEKEGCDFVYSALADDYHGRMLLRPNSKELQYYSQPDGIIIGRLISESPKVKDKPNDTPIEKLIVELFANKTLKQMISQGDYPYVLETMFEKYKIDQIKMLRYARRRNKEEDLIRFIKENTGIKLMEEA